MPSKSAAQHRLMEAAAHTPGGYGGVSQEVGEEFVRADKGKDSKSARILDDNGFITISRNPISRSGIFQYLARSVDPKHPDPDSIVNVYRPDEELSDPDAINSFKLIPIVDDHTMLGTEDGMLTAEKKGVHGTTGDEIVFENGTLLAKIKLFSQTLKDMIQSGKKDLSLGYRCEYTKSPGVYDGQPYEYIQRKMRGNHLALVDQARCNVSVLDSKTSQSMAFDHFDLALTEDEKKEFIMADEDKKKDEDMKKAEDSRAKAMDALLPRLGKVCDWAEKAMAKDAEEEKKKKEAEDAAALAAKDAKADDPYADGKDGKGKDSEEEKKKAEDARIKAAATDAAERKKLQETISGVAADVATLKSGSFVKGMLTHVAERNALAERISRHTGTFAFDSMPIGEVVAYGLEKLKIDAPQGGEVAALTGYLNGMDKADEGGVRRVTLDGGTNGGSKIDAFLKQHEAA